MISKLPAMLVGSLCCIFTPSVLCQTPPPSPQVGVAPPDGTIMVTETTNSVFVTVGNFDSFTNVTVTGTFGSQNISFLDGGQPPDQTASDGTFSADLIMPKVPVGVASNVTLRVIVTAEVPPPDPLPDPPPPPDIVMATNKVNYLVVPRPPNDNFTNAFKIPGEGAIITATNNYASMEPGEPMHAQVATVAASVWWTWSPAFNTNVLIDLAGSSFDPVLAVYTGVTVTNLQLIAASTNDIVNNLKAHVNFNARAGATYRIAIAGYDTNGVGDIRLRVAPGRLPDTNGPVTTIISPASESLFTTNVVAFAGTAKDALPDDTGVSQVFLQVNADPPVAASGTTTWLGQLTLPPGTNVVRAFAQDIAGNIGPADTIVVRFINPTNDNFSDAIELTGLAGTLSAVNERATLEPGEPLHAGNEGGHSIWYRFRAPVNGTLFLTTTNSDFDTLLDVYTGDSVTNLGVVASNDDVFTNSDFSQLTITVASNEVYYISVDGYGGTYGNIQLQYAFTTTERFFSLNISPPLLGGSVNPPAGLYLADSTLYLTAAPSRDFDFVGWSGAVNSTVNPVTLVMNQNYTLGATFRLKSYTDGFESGALTSLAWTSAGNSQWRVQSDVASGGRFAAQSGPVGDSQQSSLMLITNLLSGTCSFDYRVSSEAGWDFLEFYLNGVRLGRWSGEVGWASFQFRVVAGLNTLEWRYSKDANFSAGLDAAFIDNVYLPLPDAAIAARLTLLPLPSGAEMLQVQGLSGRPYVVQTSTNLLDWNSVVTNSSDTGTIQWTDANAVNYPVRFYRALAP
ncbi:MAG TPA: hypothetical protein VN887_04980 [Candidatus Angelobacter sp.]|nr:hypothetical protein [Candidatus Angelobacter sp.]